MLILGTRPYLLTAVKESFKGLLRFSSTQPNHLLPYQELQSNDVLINPLRHREALTQRPIHGEGKVLSVAVLGIPNSGKSTLINKLVGQFVCPESQKANTTRKNVRAILSKSETQIVFLDTPGVVNEDDIKKFKLEDSLVRDPEKSCSEADLLVVVQDVSNRYVRESLDKKILRLLCLYQRNIPAILVLNKIDTIPKSRRVYDLIRKLTCNRVEGAEGQVKISKHDSKRSIDKYLKRKEKQMCGEDNIDDIGKDWTDVFNSVKGPDKITEEKCQELLAGLIGWPGFKDVFTISALNGEGVEDLREYLLDQAKPGRWRFNERLKSDKSPEKLAVDVIKSKLLSNLEHHTPYLLKPEIEMWEYSPERELLDILASVETQSKWQYSQLLVGRGSKLKKIAKEVEECLENYFSHNVRFRLEIKQKFTVSTPDPFTVKPVKNDLYL